jgi:dipeptidyl aminopeptidase/acylaminoacyl peptidase
MWLLGLFSLQLAGSFRLKVDPDVGFSLLSGKSNDILSALFATMERTQPRIRPDGKSVGYLVPASSGALNVAVAPVDRPLDRRLVTKYAQHVRAWGFTEDGQHVLCLHDRDGDERFVLDAVEFETHEVRTLATDVEGWWVSRKDPTAVLVATPAGNADVWRVDLASGARERVASNPGGGQSFAVADGRVLAAVRVTDTGKALVRNLNGTWDPVLNADADEEVEPLGGAQASVLVRTNAGTDVVGVETVDLETGGRTVVYRSDADVEDVDVEDGRAVAVLAGRLDSGVNLVQSDRQASFDFLRTLDAGTPWVVDRAGHHWVVRYDDAGRPPRYFIVDVHRKSGLKLFDEIPWPERTMGGGPHGFLTLGLEVNSDDHDLPSYLTFPVPANGSKTWPQGKWPLVLLVHGGPWARDNDHFDPTVHWLARQGYLVLRVNFRGSRGFGRAFMERGDGAWGDGMLTDLLAGVNQVKASGRVVDGRVAVMGSSFGGYATLALLTLPGVDGDIRCGVDEFGPSDLTALQAGLPKKFSNAAHWLADRLGDDVESASPLKYAEDLRAPVLVAQGDQDPRVPLNQSDAFVKAAPPGKVQYLRFAHEGHGFTREDDRMTFYRKTAAFLSRCFAPESDDDDDN